MKAITLTIAALVLVILIARGTDRSDTSIPKPWPSSAETGLPIPLTSLIQSSGGSITPLGTLTEISMSLESDTVPALIVVTDTSIVQNLKTFAMWAFAIREKHNNTEGNIDPYSAYGFQYREWFRVTGRWLGPDRKPLDKNLVVWTWSVKDLSNKTILAGW